MLEVCAHFREPVIETFIERIGMAAFGRWMTKFRIAPPGERLRDARHAEWMANYLASQGVKNVKMSDYMRIKSDRDD